MVEKLQDVVLPSESINCREVYSEVEDININNNKIEKNYQFQKRSGTAGLSGQLYETKLLSLILFRALHDDNIKEFALGSNIEGVGALDDIVLRYKTDNKSKIIFLQAKHRDDTDKDKLTVEDIFKPHGDFNLRKYMESYFKIKQKFLLNDNNAMFYGSMADIESEIIIFTSVKENFCKKKILRNIDEDLLLSTSKDGKIFQFQYDDKDVNVLISALTNSRVIKLAKSLAKFIINDSFNKIMLCELIKIYHVFLAENVIEKQYENTEGEHDSVSQENSNNLYFIAKLRDSFLTSSDEYLVLMRDVLSKEITETKEIESDNQQKDLESFMELLCFKLPVNFGNQCFSFKGSDKKRQKRLEYLCSLIIKLLQTGHMNDKHVIVYLNDNSVGPDKIIQRKDLESYRLGGLLGNLLIYDNETEMLKFNLEEQTLSKDNIVILQKIKEKYELNTYRFDVNISNFPKLTLIHKKQDQKLIEDFLTRLKFYTNQAKEDGVENVLKSEISNLYIIEESDTFYQAKCDAIFLKVHDQVLKWWQQPHTANYLTKICNFYQQARDQVLQGSMLNVINFLYCQKFKNLLLSFDDEAIHYLKLNYFIKNTERILIIFSDEFYFTCIKLIQYFERMEQAQNYTFFDIDFIIKEDCFETIKVELKMSAVSILVLINSLLIDTSAFNKIITSITEIFKGKIILITHDNFETNLKAMCSINTFLKDVKINFNNLSYNCRRKILEQRQVIFQGELTRINNVFDNKSLDILGSNILLEIIQKDNVIIGEALTSSSYSSMVQQYVNRSISRYITFNYEHYKLQQNNAKTPSQLYFIRDEFDTNVLSVIKKDIVLTSESKTQFDSLCNKYNKRNIHWFKESTEQNNMIWIQSHGYLKNIAKYLSRGTHIDYTHELNTVKDIEERIVIVNAEPGMGKSVLLTHLAINTKRVFPNLWILNIKLLDHVDQFIKWKECNININLLEVMIFLYSMIGIEFNGNFKKNISKVISLRNTNEIYLDCNDNLNISQKELRLVKLFNYFYNNNNLAILFDGFDEICPDYAHQVIEILKCLKNSKVSHLWVTCRSYNILDQLEFALETFSYQLNPLTYTEQKLLLQKLWSQNLELVQPYDNLPNKCIDEFFFIISTIIMRYEKQFTCIPLHVHMIAEVFQHYFRDYINFRVRSLSRNYNINEMKTLSNLIKLYEKFSEIKFFKIRFGEKKHSINVNDPDMRKIIEKEYKTFVENHKKIAAHYIFGKNTILTKQDSKDVHVLIKNIKSGDEKTGIIECIVCNEPQFVHYTFAEYFAVEMLFDKLRSRNCPLSLWIFFVKNVLINDKRGIRRFINSKLEKERNLGAELNSGLKFKIILKILLQQQSRFSINAITVALHENLEHIATFLIQCLKFSVTKINLRAVLKLFTDKTCMFCLAIRKIHLTVIKDMIQIIKDLDCTKLRNLFYCYDTMNSLPLSPLMSALFHMETSHLIFECLLHYNSDFIVDLFTLGAKPKDSPNHEVATVAHFLGINGFLIKNCWVHLMKLDIHQRVAIFCVKNSEGQTPLHFAARENNYDFFFAMDKLLGREELRKICTTADLNGVSPICSFPYDGVRSKLESFQSLLQIVYDDRDIDVESFVSTKISKLTPQYNTPPATGNHFIPLSLCVSFGGMSLDLCLSTFFDTRIP